MGRSTAALGFLLGQKLGPPRQKDSGAALKTPVKSSERRSGTAGGMLRNVPKGHRCQFVLLLGGIAQRLAPFSFSVILRLERKKAMKQERKWR